MVKFSNIKSSDALKRSGTAPSAATIGPSAAGKSTLINSVVNSKISELISIGIGEKSQTTLIPSNVVLDSRIANEDTFAIKLTSKPFEKKLLYIEIQEELCEQYCKNAQDVTDTIDALNDEWFDGILEPDDASYHLKQVKDRLDLQQLKDAVEVILNEIEEGDESFSELVKKKKKEVTGQKIGAPEIRRMVFEDLWGNVSEEAKEGLEQWLDNIGKMLNEMLDTLMDAGGKNDIVEYGLTESEELPNGSAVIKELYNPYTPYSLIIADITIACRPRQELIDNVPNDIPFRFCFRDTVGLTQTGIDDVSIRNALDAGLNYKTDSLLLLFSLEERNDVLAESCKIIAEKLTKANKLDIPVYVLFTKADRIIGTKIAHKCKGKLVISQEDYDNNIMTAIEELNSDIESILARIPKESVEWLSMRYLDESMDPIQKALSINNELRSHFTPQGLYGFINGFTAEIQRRILPEGMKNPVFVTVRDTDKPAVIVKLDRTRLSNIIDNISDTLTNDVDHKDVVNGYQITTKYTISGRSVVAYWKKLAIGLGHKTNATVYGNFSINMKGMLNKILTENINNLLDLYEKDAVSTIADNISNDELARLIQVIDKECAFSEDAFRGMNPEVVSRMSEHEKNMQILHNRFRAYFEVTGKYFTVMDRVAYQLSYGNKRIQNTLTKTYNGQFSYDKTIRQLQVKFKKIFATNDFKDIVAEEIGNAMTELVNKFFVII